MNGIKSRNIKFVKIFSDVLLPVHFYLCQAIIDYLSRAYKYDKQYIYL